MKNPFYRKPDFYVGDKHDPYMLRWWVIPRNKWFNIYLHKFLRDDEDRACHSHPWPSTSLVLKGKYIEHRPIKFLNSFSGKVEIVDYEKEEFDRWSFIRRAADYFHRIELFKDNDGKPRPVWTLFFTGSKTKEWYFLCPQGLVHWKDFVDEIDEGNIGKGCGG